MRIVVLGAHGMLGTGVYSEVKSRGMRVTALGHREADVTSNEQLWLKHVSGGSVVINCAGVLPKAEWKEENVDEMIQVNALAPGRIAESVLRMYNSGPYNARLFHISTDCVFSGRQEYPIPIDAELDPVTPYGQSKALGEARLQPYLATDRCYIVRTSFIGGWHGLQRWFLDHKDGETVEGWVNALWSGGTVQHVAKRLIDLVVATDPEPLDRLLTDQGVLNRYHLGEDFAGIVHLSTRVAIDKYDILRELGRKYARHDINLVGTDEPRINRALIPNWPLDKFSL